MAGPESQPECAGPAAEHGTRILYPGFQRAIPPATATKYATLESPADNPVDGKRKRPRRFGPTGALHLSTTSVG